MRGFKFDSKVKVNSDHVYAVKLDIADQIFYCQVEDKGYLNVKMVIRE